MKLAFYAFFLVTPLTVCIGQKHDVVSSSGGMFQSPSGSFEWTLGEISTETFQQSIGFLTQGFQQSFSDESILLKAVAVYPNPAENFFFIETPIIGTYQIEIFNIYGVRLFNELAVSTTDQRTHQIDVSNFSAALYQLRIVNSSTGQSAGFKLIIL